jgi:predicted homoserine dehydrogenase-like protein
MNDSASELHKIHTKSQDLMKDLPPFKIGIIGCGHVGTMILTKLLEIQSSFNNLQVIVSTR